MNGGILVVDKPEGPTSHDIVRAVRRWLGTPRVGHAGTLDPLATGVLVLCTGRATRLARYLSASQKTYRARVRLGLDTDTLDRAGRAVGPERAVDADLRQVHDALAGLARRKVQVPPSYSAKHLGGTRAYRLARAGAAAEPPPVEVDVGPFREVALEGAEVTFEVTCSAGTYVRALARDLGRALGCGAHLTALRRTRSGEFTLEAARPLEQLRELASAGRLATSLIPPGRLHLGMGAVRARPDALAAVAHGRPLVSGDWEGPEPPAGAPCRVLGPSGELLAVAEATGGGGRLQPRVVLVRAEDLSASP
jgi:tRNA pseudouridine55 synthase